MRASVVFALPLVLAVGASPLQAQGQAGAAASAATAPPTEVDPALNGQGEPPAGRDAAAAFAPGQVAAAPADQSRTADPILRFQQRNPIGAALRALSADGVALSANYVGNFAANPIGGVTHGTAESHWIDVAAAVDLGTLVGLSNTVVHFQVADFEGHNLAAEHVGSSISFQQTWRPVAGWRLTQFNIEHDFGRLNLMVGRAALNSYFGASPLNCVFMSNAACLTAYGPITAIGITAFPNSSWAAKARWAFSKRAYAQVGVFDYDNRLNAAGENGLNLSFFHGTGVLVAGEAGYETSFADDPYPRRVRIGFDINTDPGTSPLLDRNGNPAGITGLPRAQQTGTRVGLYALADQTIMRSGLRSKRNLALFGRLFVNAGASATIDWFASAGLVKTGTFARRDNDTLDLLISNTHFNAGEIEYLRDLRARAGGRGAPNRNEIVGELNYGFAAAPGVRLLPNIQFEINPDPINAPRSRKDIPTAIVVGLRLDVRLAQLFGAGP